MGHLIYLFSTLIFASNMDFCLTFATQQSSDQKWIIHSSIHLGICSSSNKGFLIHIYMHRRNALVDASTWHTTWTPFSEKLSMQGVDPLINHQLWYHYWIMMRTWEIIHIEPKATSQMRETLHFHQRLSDVRFIIFLLIYYSTYFLSNTILLPHISYITISISTTKMSLCYY